MSFTSTLRGVIGIISAMNHREPTQSVGVTDVILLREKFLQFDWLRLVVFQLKFEIPTCENFKPFVGSSINK